MHIVMENAGAQIGLFFIKKDTELFVAAKADINVERYEVVNATGINHFEDAFSKVIVNYVLRTEESVIINDTVHDKLFTNDPYIRRLKPSSILCIPVLTQSKLVGIIYLENSLTTRAFTSDRVEMLRIVAAQGAISLENINLYRHLEEKVMERTDQLKERTTQLKCSYDELKLTLENLKQTQSALEEEIMERKAVQEALEILNSALGEKVKERTAELQKINASLEEEIMERQVVQEALQVSEARYRGLLIRCQLVLPICGRY